MTQKKLKKSNKKRFIGITTISILLFLILLGIVISSLKDNENKNNLNETNNLNENNNLDENKLKVFYFWSETCGICTRQKPHMDVLEKDFPEIEIVRLEVSKSQKNRDMILQVSNSFGFKASGIPITFIGDKYWVGFSEPRIQEMRDKIISCLIHDCESPYSELSYQKKK